MTILVTGATGQLGSIVAKNLNEAGTQIRLLVRNKNKVTDFDNAEVVEGDYTDHASLRLAFKGVERAFIVSIHERPMERAKLHRNAFDAAAEAGVRFVVYTSFQGLAENATFSMARDHYLSEQYLEASGLTYAALRNSFYMESAHEQVRADGILASPSGDGKVAWVCREDIAQVAAHLLLNPPQESEAFDVTGPEAPKFSELAHLLSGLSGKRVTFQEESYEQGLAWRKEFDLVDWDLDAWMSSVMAMGRGENARISNTVERFLGRKPCSLREFYSRNPSYIESLKRLLE